MTDWDRNRTALRQHLKTDKLENFLRWSTIRKTMYVNGETTFIHQEYQALKRKWPEWMPVVRWTGFGGDTFHSRNGYASDPNLIHQAYHLKQWLIRSGPPSGTSKGRKTVDQLQSIVEVGAGYGAMALIIYRLGFKGRYTIIDLPELTQIHQYYLSQTLPNDWSNIFWLNALPSSKLSCDLFIACHSLSEMPLPEREQLLSQVEASAYLFASAYEFEGVDNEGWFREFGGSRVGYEWKQWAHPYQENAFYSVGVRL